TVMAPAQVVEGKDLPPELLADDAVAAPAAFAPVAPLSMASASHPAVAIYAGAALSSAPLQTGRGTGADWLADLDRAARALLDAGTPEVWEALTRQFEARLILTALDSTRGRRIEAAHRLGIGRNTITRKIQELGLED
ncbi:MAG: helix-turn-helix domain-containing protein, partial [Burkholderiaceae bacterium]